MFITFIRTMLLYILIIFCMRFTGKRQIGELQTSELVITMMISNLAVLPIEDVSIPMMIGMLPILLLVCFEIILSNLSLKSPKFRKILTGNPVVIIKDGVILQKSLNKIRFTIDDVLEGLRAKNIFDLKEVSYAVVETNGSISIQKKYAMQTVTAQMLKISGEQVSPPIVIINNGKIIKENLDSAKITTTWITKLLQKENVTLKNIFLMTIDGNKEILLLKKQKEDFQ